MKLVRFCMATVMLAAFLASTTVSAATNHTGTFYHPAQNGHGLNIEELESGDLLVFWYTYRPDGTAMFLLAIASGSDGMYSGDLLAVSVDPPAIYGMVQFEGGGRLVADFTDCELDDIKVGLPVTMEDVDIVLKQEFEKLFGANC